MENNILTFKNIDIDQEIDRETLEELQNDTEIEDMIDVINDVIEELNFMKLYAAIMEEDIDEETPEIIEFKKKLEKES